MDSLPVSHDLIWHDDIMKKKSSDEERRLVIFDGPNVMHLTKGRGRPNVCGMLSLMRFFLKNEFEVCVLLSSRYMNDKVLEHSASLMKKLVRTKLVHVVQRNIIDDLIMLELAKRTGGVVLSQDLYRDHFKNEYFGPIRRTTGGLETQTVSKTRRHSITKNGHYVADNIFVFRDHDLFYSTKNHPDYELVTRQRETWSDELRTQQLQTLDELIINSRKFDITLR